MIRVSAHGRGLALALATMLGVWTTDVHAQQHDLDARAEYSLGKTAYEQKRFEEALDHFRKSYTLSGEPALLYNISSVQQSLNRPGDAAGSLHDYLAARPNDPNRVDIQNRIVSLRQAQVLLDRDAERRKLAEAEATERQRKQIELDKLRAQPVAGWLTEADAERRAFLATEHERRRKKRVAIGLGVGLGGIAVAGIVVGVVCGLGYCSPAPAKDFDFGKTTVTP